MTHSGTPAAVSVPADDVCWRELSLIDTAYGRLVYLAGLIDPNTGYYEHYASKPSVGNQGSHQYLKCLHEDIFCDWIVLSLEGKMTELRSYIAGLGAIDKVQLIDAWLRLTPYKNLVPASVQGPERHKHISDFEAILGLLQNVYGVPGPDPV
jgi:hypothetical protein